MYKSWNTPKISRSFDYLNIIINDILHDRQPRWEIIHQVSGRKSAKTFSDIITWIKMCILFPLTYCYVIRYEKHTLIDLWDQTTQIMNLYFRDIKYETKYKAIYFPNGSKLRILGLQSKTEKKISLTGLSAAVGHIAVVHFEEAYEFPRSKDNDAIKDVLEAIRGYKWLLQVYSCNPWKINNHYISYCHKKVPFDKFRLRKEGMILTENEKKHTLFHYGNQMGNEFISKKEREVLYQEYFDPVRRDVALYGIPGIEQGGVYEGYLHRIKAIMPRRSISRIVFGVDYGLKTDATCAILAGFDESMTWLAIMEEYYWKNSDEKLFKDASVLAYEVYRFVIETLKKYRVSFLVNVFLEIDDNSEAWIKMIKDFHTNNPDPYEREYSLIIRKCFKSPIKERIDVVKKLIAKGGFYVINAPNLIAEMDNSEYVEEPAEYKKDINSLRRKDINDHAINAMEYTFTRKIKSWMRN